MIWFGMVTLPLLYPIPIFIIYKKWFGGGNRTPTDPPHPHLYYIKCGLRWFPYPYPTHPSPIFMIIIYKMWFAVVSVPLSYPPPALSL